MSSSPFPSCFRATTANSDNHHLPPPTPPPPPPPTSGKPNLTTCLYLTDLGLFSLTWSRTFLRHSLHLHLHPIDHQNSLSPLSLSSQLSLSATNTTISFHLHITPFVFWKTHGSKKLHMTKHDSNTTNTPRIKVLWDLSGAKFGSRPEPVSGFYIAVVFNREMILLVGDKTNEAWTKTKALKPETRAQVLLLREEHVFGNRVYATKARFGGKNREISVDCSTNSDAKLCFYVDNKRVLKVKRLKWKFRGNERVEVDGVPINISWDVYSWLFEGTKNGGHAVFMFRFETLDPEGEEQEEERERDCYEQSSEVCPCDVDEKHGVVLWKQNSFSSSGVNGISEWRKMRNSLMNARSSSSSSISMSSASSGCSSSVMEWASVEENELSSAVGFSLLVYAWRK